MIDLCKEPETNYFPSRQRMERLEGKSVVVLDVEEATGRPRLVAALHVAPNPRIGLFVSNNPVNLWDPLGLETEIFIHRNAPAAGEPARNASGTMSVFHDGQFQFSTPVNQYGYQEGSNGIYPGTYSVLPRTDADPTSRYPNGTPAVTAPGQTNPGNAGNGYRNVYIHPEANMAGGDSRGCPTVSADAAQRIRDFMDADQRRGESTTLHIFNFGGAPFGVPVR